MRKTTGVDLCNKADFLSDYLDFKIVVRNGEKYSYIWFDYGCEGQDCVYTGTVSECNAYLNKLLRNNLLTEEWKEFYQSN